MPQIHDTKDDFLAIITRTTRGQQVLTWVPVTPSTVNDPQTHFDSELATILLEAVKAQFHWSQDPKRFRIIP